jgi:rhamnosyltransferase
MKNLFYNITPEMICAVVVTYEPDSFFESRVRVLCEQVSQVVVVDNSIKKNNADFFSDKNINEYVSIIRNRKNLGLGFALNQGVNFARSLGFTYVILFDQDSEVYENTISMMCKISMSIEDQSVGMLGAAYKSMPDSKSSVISYVKKKGIITSGSLVPISLFENVGEFRSDYFIDCIDSEFCLRLRKNGYSIYQTSTNLLKHAVGDPINHKIFGLRFLSTRHSADRRYYIARNHLVMLREYRTMLSKIPLFWFIKTIRRSMYYAFIVICFEREKILKLKAITTGIKDGLFNKMGKRDLN